MTREVVNTERTVYLIRAEDAETSTAVEEWIELNYRQLFEAALLLDSGVLCFDTVQGF